MMGYHKRVYSSTNTVKESILTNTEKMCSGIVIVNGTILKQWMWKGLFWKSKVKVSFRVFSRRVYSGTLIVKGAFLLLWLRKSQLQQSFCERVLSTSQQEMNKHFKNKGLNKAFNKDGILLLKSIFITISVKKQNNF